jgi:type VI secretion system protein ImpH
VRARLRLNVLGLCGAGLPLPAFYGEQALDDGSSGKATRDFLDLFHHRLQRLMLPIWRKYRYRARFQSGARDAFSEQMFALIGLAANRYAPPRKWTASVCWRTWACWGCGHIRPR